MICWVVIVPAVLALWGAFNKRWDVVLLAAGLYLLLVVLTRRALARPCAARRLRSVPMPSDGQGQTLPDGSAPALGIRTWHAESGGTNVCG